MKQLLFIALCAVVFTLSACQKGEKRSSDADANSQLNVTLERQEVESMMGIINAMATCLDSIQLQEGQIFRDDEGRSKVQVLQRLRAFKELLARKQEEINQLKIETISNNSTIANLQKLVDNLKVQLIDKSRQIEELQEAVETRDITIAELRNMLHSVDMEAASLLEKNEIQEVKMNRAYYIVADKKVLKEKGLLSGGFMKKDRVDLSNINTSLFDSIDVRSFDRLIIASKSPHILTPQPDSSYKLTTNADKTTTLEIIDKKAFWNVTRFLIIQE